MIGTGIVRSPIWIDFNLSRLVHRLHIDSKGAFIALFGIEYYLLLRLQAGIRTVQTGLVDKNILSVFGFNEAKSLDLIVPFYFTSCHD